MKTTEITQNERDVLKAITENEYTNGDPRGWAWSDYSSMSSTLPMSMKPKTYAGVLGSLAAKKLIEDDGVAVRLSDAGFTALEA